MCRGPPESQLLESCFPPAEHIVSALTGLRALTLPSQLNPNAGKPANYERTSQPAAQPLVKPSLTTSTLLLARSLQAQTNHVEVEKKKKRKCVSVRHWLYLLYCQVVFTPCQTGSAVKGTVVVEVCRDSPRCRNSTDAADAPHCSYNFIIGLQKICSSSLI